MSEPIVILDNCAYEPIHIPGAIQPQGVLLVVDPRDLRVLQVSENSGQFLGLEPQQLLEGGLTCFLNQGQIDSLTHAISNCSEGQSSPAHLDLPTRDPNIRLDGSVHSCEGLLILELGPLIHIDKSYFLEFYDKVSGWSARMQAAKSLLSLANEAAASVRQITGFDRVVVYRFASNGAGEVFAESKNDVMESFLGMWYPASDIPEQARRLYVLSSIRAIPDVHYRPARLVPSLNPLTHRPTNLSYAHLRSVSPIHCEYLVNMGVAASMSVSIIIDGRLWGLIACHPSEPKYVAYEYRKACTFLAQVLSGEILRREAEAGFLSRSQFAETLAGFVALMEPEENPAFSLLHQTPNLLDLIPAAGVAVVTPDRVDSVGVVPAREDLWKIVQAVEKLRFAETFATQSLQNHFPEFWRIRETVSGVIALNFSKQPLHCILFCRPEVIQTLTWGGNPAEKYAINEDGYRLSPRKSFAQWKEEMTGTSAPWTEAELLAAEELKKLILTIARNRPSPPTIRQSA